ncbi:expressed conserved protein [Echinococcus multilocularis]|uniref:Expressed conserved protein n=1 Tax=Echinococcus multilocularis TaxID=6211 RepID=A0A068YFY3_ECHMU|nr:expressed conserved protein [Echinococcus multilocularis]
MYNRVGFLRSIFLHTKRTLYQDVKPHSKLLIKSASPLEVSSLPAYEAERSSVLLPDTSVFRVDDGWKITQTTESRPSKDYINKVRVPAMRDVEIIQSSCDHVSLVNYAGQKALIKSFGPVSYAKLKLSDFSIKSDGNVVGSGYLEGNLDLVTNGSFTADNITGQSIGILFGGTNLAVHSAYCDTMNLSWITPEEPPDGVTPVELPLLSVYFGTLRGAATIEIAGDANLNIGSFEGSLYLRQRFGNVAVHIGGPCPLLEIDVAEGNVELSLPLSTVGGKISGAVEVQAPQIHIDRDALYPDSLDNWELGEVAEAQTFCANFNNPETDCETLWRVRTLRGHVKLTGASWADAMARCIERTTITMP